SKYLDQVAHLALTPAQAQGSDLFPVIPRRHTNRGPYDVSKPVDPNVLDSLAALSDHETVRIFWFAEPAKRNHFGKVAIAAAEALIADEQQSRDSSHWWRQGWSDVQTYHDGITIDAQGFDTLTNIFAKMLPDLSRQQTDAIFVKNVRDVYVATAPVFGL